MEFSRQEHCSGLPFLPSGDLPNPGIKPRSPALQADSVAQMVKRLSAVQETQVRSLGRKDPGEGNGSSFHYSCLENSVDRGAWLATVHGLAKSWTPLSD